MLKTRFDIDTLSEATHEIAWVVPGRLLGGLLTRAMIVPAGWAALLTRAGLDALLVAAGKRLAAKAAEEVLFVRTTPVTCTAESDELQSSDGYPVRGSISVPIRILAEPSELSAFRRTVFHSGERMAAAGLQRQLQPSLLRILHRLATSHTAADLTAAHAIPDVQRVVESEIAPRCLAGGLSIDGPATVQFESPTYREQHRRTAELKRREQHAETARQIQKALASAQAAHLSHLVALISKMRDVQREHPRAPLPELLRTFTEPERGQLYAALWHVTDTERRTRWIAVASGNEILLFEPGSVKTPSRRILVPDDFGPLRSLSMDEQSRAAGVFLAGAAVGLHVLNAETGELRASFGPPGAVRSEMVFGGVNAAAMSEEYIFATHSELGLLMWPGLKASYRDNKPRAQSEGIVPATAQGLYTEITARAQAVRCARVAEESIWFAADETIYSAPLGRSDRPAAYTGSRAPITALAVADGKLYAGNAAGQLLTWDATEPQSHRVLRPATGQPLESLHIVNTGGIERILLADRSHGLTELVIGDRFTRLYDARLPIRRGAAADDLLAAMNDNRDRLLVWDPRSPDAPPAMAVIPHLTGGTIQDLCLITT